MDDQFISENGEAHRLATELAMLQGTTVQQAVLDAVRSKLDRERELQSKLARVKQLTAEFRAMLEQPLPTSDHRFLYDPETGLPI